LLKRLTKVLQNTEGLFLDDFIITDFEWHKSSFIPFKSLPFKFVVHLKESDLNFFLTEQFFCLISFFKSLISFSESSPKLKSDPVRIRLFLNGIAFQTNNIIPNGQKIVLLGENYKKGESSECE